MGQWVSGAGGWPRGSSRLYLDPEKGEQAGASPLSLCTWQREAGEEWGYSCFYSKERRGRADCKWPWES